MDQLAEEGAVEGLSVRLPGASPEVPLINGLKKVSGAKHSFTSISSEAKPYANFKNIFLA